MRISNLGKICVLANMSSYDIHNFRMETMYNTTCMAAKMSLSSKVPTKYLNLMFHHDESSLRTSVGVIIPEK